MYLLSRKEKAIEGMNDEDPALGGQVPRVRTGQ